MADGWDKPDVGDGDDGDGGATTRHDRQLAATAVHAAAPLLADEESDEAHDAAASVAAVLAARARVVL